jgi:hypothetical protein
LEKRNYKPGRAVTGLYINMKDPNEKKEETTPHTVTAEDLANNPELAEAGVKEGEEIGIPENVQENEDTKG